MTTTHINIRGVRRHDMSVDCWCHPDVQTFRYRNERGEQTVVDHHGGIHRTVADDLTRGFEAFPHVPLRARRGTRND